METVHQNSKTPSIIYNFALTFEGVYCGHFLLRLLGILLTMEWSLDWIIVCKVKLLIFLRSKLLYPWFQLFSNNKYYIILYYT